MQHTPFFQKAPTLGNQFIDDDALQSTLQLYLTQSVYKQVEPELESLGARVVSKEMLEACADAESHLPSVESYDSFGNPISRLRTSGGWKHMKTIAAEEGIVATAFERKYGARSRVVQFAKYLLYNPSAATFGCPLAMTDGAARLLELTGQFDNIRKGLLARSDMLTSGQWMTERGGGSDLTNSETVAVKAGDKYLINGFKWFSSATDADVSLSLARTQEGMSLFLIDVKAAGSTIKIARLKKKLGTHPLPTAELELKNVPATLIGTPGKGIKTIATILNITRIYTAMGSVSSLRRAYAVVLAYSQVRMIGKTPLAQKPLHAALLARMHTTLTGLMFLCFYVVSLLGKDECGEASDEERNILRGLTPLVKAYVSKLSYLEIGECCEALGGLGYIENNDVELNVARILRDALVMCIWEGTTNVLSLDFARALKSADVRTALHRRFGSCVQPALDMRDEATFKDVMFHVAHEITGKLLLEAGDELKSEQVWKHAQAWTKMRNPGHVTKKSEQEFTARL